MNPLAQIAARVVLEAFLRQRAIPRDPSPPRPAWVDDGAGWQSAGAMLSRDELESINAARLECRAWVRVDDALELWPLAGLVELDQALEDIDRAGPARAGLVRVDVRGRHE